MSISVGIPTYNQGNYLRKTIISLLNQRTPPAEIVISNNHSTDDTEEVLSEFKSHIRVVRPLTHLNVMAHWNFLASRLNSKWFALLSSDDIALPNYITTLQRGINRSPQSVLIRSGSELIDEAGNPIEKRYILTVRKITRPPITLYEQLQGPKTSFAAFAVRKDAWEKVGGFPEECAFFGDWGFWVKISPLGNFIYEHDIISQYRTSYRPGIDRERILSEIRDEITMASRIIPDAVRQICHIDRKRLEKAATMRFKLRMSHASSILGPEERDIACDLFQEWGNAIRFSGEINGFAAGKIISHPDKWKNIKSLARHVYQIFPR